MIKVTITSKPGVPYQHELTARTHTIVSDVAADLNGGDTGPTPHELALLAIGTCGAMTMQMFAEKSKIPLTAVRVTVTEDVIADPNDATATVPHIVETFEVEGNGLTDAHLASLERVAKKCPVAKLFMNNSKIMDAKVNRAPVAAGSVAP